MEKLKPWGQAIPSKCLGVDGLDIELNGLGRFTLLIYEVWGTVSVSSDFTAIGDHYTSQGHWNIFITMKNSIALLECGKC